MSHGLDSIALRVIKEAKYQISKPPAIIFNKYLNAVISCEGHLLDEMFDHFHSELGVAIRLYSLNRCRK